MTVVCGGGASTFKAEWGQAAYVTPAALAAMLNNVPVTWAVPLAAYLAAKTYDLTTFCTVDPPADPGFTALDALAVLNVANPIVFTPAATKLQQLIDRFAWYQMCKCVSIATPAPPAPPAAPANLVNVAPPIAPPTVQPCQIIDSGVKSFGVGTPGRNVDGIGISTGFFTAQPPIVAPAGATTILATYKRNAVGGVHSPIAFTMNFWPDLNSGTGRVQSSYAVLTTGPQTVTQVYAVPVSAQAITVTLQSSVDNSTDTGEVVLSYYCGTVPGQPVQPCCPPDTNASGLLEQVLGIVTLLQRQLAPFAYLLGAAHSGLTGTGSFAIQGLLGVKVELTTLPASLGNIAGTPAEIFDAGFVSLGTLDGYPQSYRIEHNPEVILPPRASAFTECGYTLPPGVVATITELVREP